MRNIMSYLKREFFYQEIILVFIAHMVSIGVYRSILPESFDFFITCFSVVQVFFLIGFAQASRDERLLTKFGGV